MKSGALKQNIKQLILSTIAIQFEKCRYNVHFLRKKLIKLDTEEIEILVI